ncbi:MAG: type II toxin-antitoxin system RatA family toxin [Robiginitomaculum sp.]|nr:type II toxin-antitoxin system RatA family toxin [Robiginitomaculum sp.]
MTVRHVFRHLPYPPDDLHNLAWDVEDYPSFIHFITALRILKKTPTNMRAEVRVRYKVLRESFITDVRRDLDTKEIFVSLAHGPLRTLENHWRFHPLSDGSTLVEFWVEFSFSIPWLGKIFRNKALRAEHQILQAFETQASKRFTPISTSALMDKEIADLQALRQHG